MFAKLVQPNTKVLFLESPSSLTMEVPDIPAIVKAVRAVKPRNRYYDPIIHGRGRTIQSVRTRY